MYLQGSPKVYIDFTRQTCEQWDVCERRAGLTITTLLDGESVAFRFRNPAKMRWSFLLALIVSLFLLGSLAAPFSDPGRRDLEVANLNARQEKETDPTTTENTTSEATTTTQTDASKTVTDASTATEAKTSGTTTHATTTTSAASATSTVPSLDGTTPSSQQQTADSTKPTYSGGLPIKPVITPAWGVGGFILIALGAILAFIGVRQQWYSIFDP